jgi:hypothetical protein
MENNYSAGLMSQSFWFIEFKKCVRLKSQGLTDVEIKKMCIEENLFGAVTENRVRRMAGYVVNRLAAMDEQLIKIFCEADVATQKLINLIMILKLDQLFLEFMFEVYREKIILGSPSLGEKDINVFFTRKEIQSEAVAGWKDSTKQHLRSCYLNFMVDANLLTLIDKEKRITPPMIDIILEKYLKMMGEETILKALTGGN